MSDEISTHNDQHEKVIITDSAAAAQNIIDPLNIDLDQISNKDLMAFNKKDLLGVAKKENVLSDLKDWQIERLSKSKIVKRLRSKKETKKNDQPKKETKEHEQDTENILLLQSALIDIFTEGDPGKLDLYCAKTLQNNNTELMDQEQAEKLEKIMVKFSLVHLIIRNNFGGYKNLFSKAKDLFIKLKSKYQERKANATNNRA